MRYSVWLLFMFVGITSMYGLARDDDPVAIVAYFGVMLGLLASPALKGGE